MKKKQDFLIFDVFIFVLTQKRNKKVKTSFNFFEFYDCSTFDTRPLCSLAYSNASQSWITTKIKI